MWPCQVKVPLQVPVKVPLQIHLQVSPTVQSRAAESRLRGNILSVGVKSECSEASEWNQPPARPQTLSAGSTTDRMDGWMDRWRNRGI